MLESYERKQVQQPTTRKASKHIVKASRPTPPTCDICCSTTSPTAGAALELLLVTFWPLLAALGTLLAALGALLGRSWALFGPSWPLSGRSWNDTQKLINIDAKNYRFGRPKALQNDAKIEPKSDPKYITKTKRTRTELRRK